MSTTYTVTVLGLGAMGLPIGTGLSHPVDRARLRHRTGTRAGNWRLTAGIRTFTSARAAAQEANALLLAVRNGEQLNDVLFGEAGVAKEAAHTEILVVHSRHSTVEWRQSKRRVAKLAPLRRRTGSMRPLSGGPVRSRRRRPADRRWGARTSAIDAARPVTGPAGLNPHYCR